MLKFFFFFLFTIFFCILKKNYLIIQNVLFLIFFFFLLGRFKNLEFFFGIRIIVDFISFRLISLRIWICSLIIIARFIIFFKNLNKNKFIFIILILMIFLFFTFRIINLFLFYFFFERSLIPTFFLILGWGYQPERLQAGLYLLFYTLFASLPLLIILFLIFFEFNRLIFRILNLRLKNFFFFFF